MTCAWRCRHCGVTVVQSGTLHWHVTNSAKYRPCRDRDGRTLSTMATPGKVAGFHTGLSVGLGICGPCRAPGAHFFPAPTWAEGLGIAGIWLCDSCMDPRLVHSRIDSERAAYARCQEASI